MTISFNGQKSNLEPLIVSPSPRDIPSVIEALGKVNFIDKLLVKYYRPEYRAYELIQDFFLKNEQYTHLIIWPDDLLVSVANVTQLLLDLNQHDYPVIGGICQIDNDWYYDKMIVSLRPLYPKRDDRFRYFEKFEDYYKYDQEINQFTELLPYYKDKPILRTFWQGFPFMAIKRSVLQDIEFRNDYQFNNIPKDAGCCLDDVFCWDCLQNEISMWTDLRIRMNHLKINDNNTSMLIVKGKEEYTQFVKKEVDIDIKKLFQIKNKG
jgi:hypothetical protein